jgi:2-keto-4-pentenoate hydratase
MSDHVERCARLLLDAHAARRQFVAGADPAPASLDDAYRIQDRVLAALGPGRRPTAWKVSPPRPGFGSVASPIPADRVLRSPAAVRAASYNVVGIEAEVAFRLGRDLAPRAAPYSAAEIADAVAEALVAIELVDTRLANREQAPMLWNLADFQSNGALVVGGGRRDWRGHDFRAQRVELLVDGAARKDAVGAYPGGDPFAPLPWIAAHCAARCGGLRAGDVVTTGSWTGLEFVGAGAEVVARFPGIGEARVSVAR